MCNNSVWNKNSVRAVRYYNTTLCYTVQWEFIHVEKDKAAIFSASESTMLSNMKTNEGNHLSN